MVFIKYWGSSYENLLLPCTCFYFCGFLCFLLVLLCFDFRVKVLLFSLDYPQTHGDPTVSGSLLVSLYSPTSSHPVHRSNAFNSHCHLGSNNQDPRQTQENIQLQLWEWQNRKPVSGRSDHSHWAMSIFVICLSPEKIYDTEMEFALKNKDWKYPGPLVTLILRIATIQ